MRGNADGTRPDEGTAEHCARQWPMGAAAADTLERLTLVNVATVADRIAKLERPDLSFATPFTMPITPRAPD
eukprot:5471098-Pyramimonas_sp.AAC.1